MVNFIFKDIDPMGFVLVKRCISISHTEGQSLIQLRVRVSLVVMVWNFFLLVWP